METWKCDACGKEMPTNPDGHGYLEMSLDFRTNWNKYGSIRDLVLCHVCMMRLFDFTGLFYDTGRILSKAKGEAVKSDGGIVTDHPEANTIRFPDV